MSRNHKNHRPDLTTVTAPQEKIQVMSDQLQMQTPDSGVGSDPNAFITYDNTMLEIKELVGENYQKITAFLTKNDLIKMNIQDKVIPFQVDGFVTGSLLMYNYCANCQKNIEKTITEFCSDCKKNKTQNYRYNPLNGEKYDDCVYIVPLEKEVCLLLEVRDVNFVSTQNGQTYLNIILKILYELTYIYFDKYSCDYTSFKEFVRSKDTVNVFGKNTCNLVTRKPLLLEQVYYESIIAEKLVFNTKFMDIFFLDNMYQSVDKNYIAKFKLYKASEFSKKLCTTLDTFSRVRFSELNKRSYDSFVTTARQMEGEKETEKETEKIKMYEFYASSIIPDISALNQYLNLYPIGGKSFEIKNDSEYKLLSPNSVIASFEEKRKRTPLGMSSVIALTEYDIRYLTNIFIETGIPVYWELYVGIIRNDDFDTEVPMYRIC